MRATDSLILRHIASGLPKEPYRRSIDRLPQTSAQKTAASRRWAACRCFFLRRIRRRFQLTIVRLHVLLLSSVQWNRLSFHVVDAVFDVSPARHPHPSLSLELVPQMRAKTVFVLKAVQPKLL